MSQPLSSVERSGRILFAALLVVSITVPFAGAKPVLDNHYLSSYWGTVGMDFVFKVTYTSVEGRNPEYVKIFIDGEAHDMEKAGGTAATGMIYQYSLAGTQENAFYHNHYYEASDGYDTVKHFDPTTADQTFGGPMILTERLDRNQIYFFSTSSPIPVWNYSIGKDWALNVETSYDGNTVVAKTSDYIHAFSRDGRLLWKFSTGNGNGDNADPSGFAAVSADGSNVFASGNGKVYGFSRESGTPSWNYNTDAGVYNIQLSSDANYIAVGRYDDRLDLVAGDGKTIWHYDVDGGFHALGISSDGRYIIGGTHCPDRAGYFFFRESNAPLWRKTLNEQGSPVWSGIISSNGEYAIFGLDGSNAVQDDIFFFSRNGSLLWTYKLDTWVRSVAISSSGDFAVAGTGAGQVLLFSKENSTPLWKYGGGSKVGAVDISPDGDYVAAGTKGKKVLLFSRTGNVPLWEFQADEWVNGVALSGDGKYLAVSTGAPQYIYEGHSEGSATSGSVEAAENRTGESVPVMESVCGDGMCENSLGENNGNCAADCMPDKTTENSTPAEKAPVSQGIKACANLIEIIINFFHSLFGNPICR